jgi:hypothetical protein
MYLSRDRLGKRFLVRIAQIASIAPFLFFELQPEVLDCQLFLRVTAELRWINIAQMCGSTERDRVGGAPRGGRSR